MRSEAARIVGCYAANNKLTGGDLVIAIQKVQSALMQLSVQRLRDPTAKARALGTASKHHLVCLNCGKKLQTLKRHLKAAHGQSIDDYRKLHQLSPSSPTITQRFSSILRRSQSGGHANERAEKGVEVMRLREIEAAAPIVFAAEEPIVGRARPKLSLRL